MSALPGSSCEKSPARMALVNTVAFLQKALDHGYAEAAVPLQEATRPGTAVQGPVQDLESLQAADTAALEQRQEELVRRLEARFGLERHHIFTHHPLIRRKALAHVHAPSPR